MSFKKHTLKDRQMQAVTTTLKVLQEWGRVASPMSVNVWYEGTGTCIAKMQQTDDGTTWVDVALPTGQGTSPALVNGGASTFAAITGGIKCRLVATTTGGAGQLFWESVHHGSENEGLDTRTA